MSLAVNRGRSPFVSAFKYPGIIDRSLAVRRLIKNACTLIAAHPRAVFLGPDEAVERLAASLGFDRDDLAVLRIMIGPEKHTLVCAPEKIWREQRLHLIELKRLSGHAGKTCVLVPEGAIHRQPRLGTARMIEDASGIHVTMEQRMELLVHLIERGYSTLFDCACVINHSSPFSAVLHLVSIGVLSIKGSSLSLETKIELCEPSQG